MFSGEKEMRNLVINECVVGSFILRHMDMTEVLATEYAGQLSRICSWDSTVLEIWQGG